MQFFAVAAGRDGHQDVTFDAQRFDLTLEHIVVVSSRCRWR